MTPPSIAERLRELANHLPLLERNRYPESALRSLASEIEEVAKEMRTKDGRWTITPGLEGGQTMDAVSGVTVDRWASRLAAPEEK